MALASSSTSGVRRLPGPQWRWRMHGSAPAPAVMTGRTRLMPWLLRRMLSNLRKLTLDSVVVSLPALQPAATRLQGLELLYSRLQGSADSFLTNGWTALTSLALTHIRMDNATLTAALELPALEHVCLGWVTGHRGRELLVDQLTGGSCPQVSRLEFQLREDLTQASEAGRQQSYRLGNLTRLAELHVSDWSHQAHVDLDLDLPPSLTQLKFSGLKGGGSRAVDFFWALREAARCAGRGAHLHRLICECAEAYLQPAQWGASLDEQHRRLGGQLGSLRKLEVEVRGTQEQLLSAVGAVASAAPSLVRLKIIVADPVPCVEVSPICSASLESIRVQLNFSNRPELPPPQVLLAFLPGCTRLREVVVRCGRAVEGAAVKIRCHGFSRRCIVPVDAYAGYYNVMPERLYASAVDDVEVKFLDMPPSEQGVQACTVLYGCHAAGPEQLPMWGHAVMPGIL